MKAYPSIPAAVIPNTPVLVFDKLDGSNLRAEWNPKRGFYKFGSRTQLIDHHSPFWPGIELFLAKYGDQLDRIFRLNKWKKAIAFFEYWGDRSFAGSHHPDDEMKVTLFDVAIENRGLLEPSTFLEHFGRLDHPKLLFSGEIDDQFVQQVKSGNLPGMTFEGVVCKGAYISPGRPLSFKIKNRAWIEKLREKYGANSKKFKELL